MRRGWWLILGAIPLLAVILIGLNSLKTQRKPVFAQLDLGFRVVLERPERVFVGKIVSGTRARKVADRSLGPQLLRTLDELGHDRAEAKPSLDAVWSSFAEAYKSGQQVCIFVDQERKSIGIGSGHACKVDDIAESPSAASAIAALIDDRLAGGQ